jgi:hypothetical protein
LEAAAAAALGNFADAVVVKDLSSAVTALTTLRRENLGQADVLVFEPGNGNKRSIPSGLSSLSSYVRSNSLTSATFGAFAGKHPPDQNMNLTVDLEYGSTPTGEKSAGGIWLAYSRNAARWARSSSLGGDFPVTLV